MVKVVLTSLLVCLCWGILVWSAATVADVAAWPFVWADVCLVFMCAGIAAAVGLRNVIRKSAIRRTLVFLAGGVLAVSFAAALFAQQWLFPLRSYVPSIIARYIGTLFVGSASATIASAWFDSRRPEDVGDSVATQAASSLLLVAILFVLPEIYLASRFAEHNERLSELLGQYRLKASSELASQLAAVDPTAKIGPQKESARRLAHVLGKEVANVSEQTEQILNTIAQQPHAEFEKQAAKNLAILERQEQATQILESLVNQNADDVEATLLLATVAEHQGNYREALQYYQAGAEWLSNSHDSLSYAASQAFRETAYRGIGFTQRKLGNNPAAERAWKSLVKLSPTAENHFLMAKFYADAQRAELARHHATIAMHRDPRQYKVQSEALINQLENEQLGCFSVYLQRNAR
ncbi:tetratricopeptide repeat protein [Thalassoroseus pseudoceratinae]|uniref:tetratricopeptide repeat protein n=1 Tax=Thalassoroseus pseudoceratinae TaxID=2713176 RepID=UPI001422056D|nr:hypothetical protein [Thalassoroseus pseudoceratinae]